MRLDLEDDGEDHRPPAGALLHELTDGVVNVLLEELQLGDILGEEARERSRGFVSGLVEDGAWL